jgi:hypothetical protein
MHASAIRKGDVGLAVRDVIFARAGLSGSIAVCVDDRDIARSILSGADPTVQHGATRGYKPSSTRAGPLDHRGIKATPDEIIITTGSQQASICARGFIDVRRHRVVEPGLHRRDDLLGTRRAIWSASSRTQPASTSPTSTASCCERGAGGVAFVYVVPNFQNPSGLPDDARRRAELLAWAPARDVLIIEDDPHGARFDDVAAASAPQGGRPRRPGRIEQLLQDRCARVSRRLDHGRAGARRPSRNRQAVGRSLHQFDRSAIRLRDLAAGVLKPVVRLRAAISERPCSRGAAPRAGRHVTWPEPKGGFFLGVIRRRDRHRCAADPGDRPRRRVRSGQCSTSSPIVSTGRGCRFPPASGANRGGALRLAAAVREELEVRGRSGQEPPADGSAANGVESRPRNESDDGRTFAMSVVTATSTGTPPFQKR